MIHPIKMPPASLGQRFGDKWADYSQFGWLGHNGWDYPAPLGTPIVAAHDGWIIEQIAKDTGYGLRISQKIEYNGKTYVAVYGHMQRLEKPQNMAWKWSSKSYPVKEGQVIGYVNSTGFSTGNHLHFGITEYTSDGKKLNSNNGYGGAIDPLPFIERKPMNPNIKIFRNGSEYIVGIRMTSEEGLSQKLVETGCYDLLKDGKPDFEKINKLAQIL